MANEEHLAILRQGVEAWLAWKAENRKVRPDLTEADLTGASLNGVSLSGANLTGANLNGASLRETDLYGADLTRANLTVADLTWATLNRARINGADLTEANLTGADLTRANLTRANLSGAFVGATVFAALDLSEVKGLDTVQHLGPSSIGLDTLYHSGGKIPEAFLRGCGVPDAWIEYLPSLLGAMEPIQFYSCFISYSTKDEDFAQRLYSRMRDNNLRVWFANEDLKGGAKLHEQIDEAIRIYDKLILVLSTQSLRSKWVMSEVRRTRKAELESNRRKFFPIRLVDMKVLDSWECLDPDTRTDLAAEIREYYIPDFRRWKDHDSFEREFAKLLEGLKAVDAPPAPRVEPQKVNKAEIDLSLGLEQLRQMVKDTPTQSEFATLEARLLGVLQEERLYGINENTRAIRAQVIHVLNEFVSANGLGSSFTELCRP